MNKLIILIAVLFTAIIGQAQVKIGDATLPKTITFNEEKLILNGAGLREKFFFDIYAGGLYLKSKNKNGTTIAGLNETMAVKIHILSGMMTKKKLASALRSGFERSTNGNLAALNDRIDKFIGFVIKEIEVGQVFDLVYEHGKGSVLYRDGNEKGYVEGMDFKKALFNIWLGNKPVDKDLKKSMLGSI